jgi:hypothetical protein
VVFIFVDSLRCWESCGGWDGYIGSLDGEGEGTEKVGKIVTVFHAYVSRAVIGDPLVSAR